jgi:hypothetical protein
MSDSANDDSAFQGRKMGRPRNADRPVIPWEEVDRLLVFGETVRDEETGREDVRYPSLRELGRRYGVSGALIGRYSVQHRCMERREENSARERISFEQKVVEKLADAGRRKIGAGCRGRGCRGRGWSAVEGIPGHAPDRTGCDAACRGMVTGIGRSALWRGVGPLGRCFRNPAGTPTRSNFGILRHPVHCPLGNVSFKLPMRDETIEMVPIARMSTVYALMALAVVAASADSPSLPT